MFESCVSGFVDMLAFVVLFESLFSIFYSFWGLKIEISDFWKFDILKLYNFEISDFENLNQQNGQMERRGPG